LPTGRSYHQYLNPERAMPKEAFEVHGLGDEFLQKQPRFAEIAAEFLEFIGAEAPLIIHNASFDLKFLNAELILAGMPQIGPERALDTLLIARRRFPGAPASLDALCRRFGIDNSGREKHGALLDSEILAEVYLELIGGRQPDFGLSVVAAAGPGQPLAPDWRPRPRPEPLPQRLTSAEEAAHAAFVAKLGPDALWRQYLDYRSAAHSADSQA